MTTVKWHGAKVKAAVKDGALDGLRAAAELAFEESQANVPEDTGRLKQSGEIVIDEVQLSAEIRYGESLPDNRAVVVHEKLDLKHDTGQAKYLEQPLITLRERVQRLFASRIRKKLQ